jgi:hypothetical protein
MGWAIVILGFLYARVSTNFYGNNFWPTCDAEIVADGLALIVCSIGFAVLSVRNQ